MQPSDRNKVFGGRRAARAYFLVSGALGFLISGAARAERPVTVFAPGAGKTVGAAADAWHSEFEGHGDYSETWYFAVHTEQGGLLIASFSITNLGLRTFDAVVDAHHYAAGRRRFALHREYRRSDIVAQPGRLDVAVGRNRIWRDADGYRLLIAEDEMRVRLEMRAQLPPQQVGDGKIYFDADDRSKLFAVGLSVPRGRCTGTVTANGQTMSLRGWGYHGHSWTTVKLPTVLSAWSALMLFDSDITLLLQEQTLSEAFGSGRIRFGVLGDGGKILSNARHFSLEPERWERDEASGYDVPSAWRVHGSGGGYRLSGTLRRQALLDSVDVLGVLSWPVRALVKALYGKPFTMRYLVSYELTIIDGADKQRQIRGIAPLEASYYRQPALD